MSLSSSQRFVIISIDYTDQNNQIVCELKLLLKKRVGSFYFQKEDYIYRTQSVVLKCTQQARLICILRAC